jgi:hypothetical protein
MAGFQNLIRRPNGHADVPSPLRRAVGKAELHKTTGCRDLALAKIVATELRRT